MQQVRVACALIAIACAPQVEIEDRPGAVARAYFEPPAPPDAAPAVLRIVVPGRAAAQLMLFDGELSAYHRGRVRSGDLPKTLSKRLVPAIAYSSEIGAVLAPHAALSPLGVYTLGAVGDGALLVFQVRPNGPTVMQRRWPWSDAATGSSAFVYCASEEVVPPNFFTQVPLQPGDVFAQVIAGAGHPSVLAGRCVTLRVSAVDEVPRVPPPSIAGLVLDPAPVSVVGVQVHPPSACPSGWRATKLGCLDVQDDRMAYRAGFGPAALAVDAGDVAEVFSIESQGEVMIKGFVPGTHRQISMFEFGHGGLESHQETSVEMLAVRAHPVINEVLANPIGAEPAQEWVEIYNDGLGTWQMAGYVLTDAAGSIELPAAELQPGQFALLTNEEFDAGSAVDVRPAAGTLVIRLPELGKHGLSNAGEPLALLGLDGAILSTFPALKHSKAGVSAARRPDALSSAASSFGLSAEPGASPGAPNAVIER